jgi:hypothetical protein
VDLSVVPAFYLAANGVTVMCPAAQVGDVGDVGGVTYTKRDRAGLDALLAVGEYWTLEATCTSGITDMSWLFRDHRNFNADIRSWDVSSVRDVTGMFYLATAFSRDISQWTISGVTSLYQTFLGTLALGRVDLNGWDVSEVIDMEETFSESGFSGDISQWDVSNVVTMGDMFFSSSFDGSGVGIGDWQVGAVEDMAFMFMYSPFDGDISGWDVSSVQTMRAMFATTSFSQDISGWDVSAVRDFGAMFLQDAAFDQPIGRWDVSAAMDMEATFSSAENFNQDLSPWCVRRFTAAPRNFDDDTSSWVLPRPVWETCSPASLEQSTLVASAASIPADGSSAVILTVQLKDVDGVDLTENSRTLTFDTPSQGSISAVTVNNDGTFTATYTAGSTAGNVTIVGRLDGVAMTQTVTITLN